MLTKLLGFNPAVLKTQVEDMAKAAIGMHAEQKRLADFQNLLADNALKQNAKLDLLINAAKDRYEYEAAKDRFEYEAELSRDLAIINAKLDFLVNSIKNMTGDKCAPQNTQEPGESSDAE